MRKLDGSYKLQADSVGDIRDEWIALATRIIRVHGIMFGGSGATRAKPGHVLNGLVLWFMGLTPDEQARIAVYGVERLKAVLAETEDGRTASPAPPPALPFTEVPVPGQPPKPALSPKRKKGNDGA